MKKLPSEFVFIVAALLIAAVFVHSVYILHIRPVAEMTLKIDRERMAEDPEYVADRSMYVVIKDYEQQATITLMLWALAIMAFKAIQQRREAEVLESELLRLPDGVKILPEDTFTNSNNT